VSFKKKNSPLLKGLLAGHRSKQGYAVGRSMAAFVVLVDQLLEAKGWQRKDLAVRLGVTESALSQKLQETSNITFESMVKILWELDVPLYDVFDELGKGLEGEANTD